MKKGLKPRARSDSSRAVKPQTMVRGVELLIKKSTGIRLLCQTLDHKVAGSFFPGQCKSLHPNY